jgi:hypothetical protein
MEEFSRQKLAECLEEIGQSELKEPVITGEYGDEDTTVSLTAFFI